MRRLSWVLGAVVLSAGLVVGCGDDDGADVRSVGEDPSASGSGSASGSASGSGSGSTAAEGCPEVEEPEGGIAAGGASEVPVTLDEYSVEVDTPEETVVAGDVTFVAENAGEEPHELVIVEGDDPGSLPVEDGQVQEDQLEEGAFIGEIEAFPAGETCEGTFTLPQAGSYVLFCNIVETEEDGAVESHFEEGMVTTLTAVVTRG